MVITSAPGRAIVSRPCLRCKHPCEQQIEAGAESSARRGAAPCARRRGVARAPRSVTRSPSAAPTTACGSGASGPTVRIFRRAGRACSATRRTRSATHRRMAQPYPPGRSRARGADAAGASRRAHAAIRGRASHASQGRRLALGAGTRGGRAPCERPRVSRGGLNLDITARNRRRKCCSSSPTDCTACEAKRAYTALVQQVRYRSSICGKHSVRVLRLPATRVRMLAHWYGGEFAPCEEFDRHGNACEEVILGGQARVRGKRSRRALARSAARRRRQLPGAALLRHQGHGDRPSRLSSAASRWIASCRMMRC